MKKHIPNLITSLNLSAGFFAIILASSGQVISASWLILAAIVFDFLDGFSARMLKEYSAIGKELDSLADIVSFGVAPALIIFQLLSYANSMKPMDYAGFERITGSLIMTIPVLMPVCAALRLAIFNLDTTQVTSFKGLPTPANALAVISIIISGHFSNITIFRLLMGSPVFLVIMTVILSLLMVSRLPLLSLKFSDLKVKGNEGRYILAGLIVVSFAFFGIAAAPLIIPLYIIVSLLSRLF